MDIEIGQDEPDSDDPQGVFIPKRSFSELIKSPIEKTDDEKDFKKPKTYM